MKKIMMAVAIVCAAVAARAASVQWTATATSAYNGQTMYLLTSIAESYDSVDAFVASAVDAGTVTKTGPSYKVSQHAASHDDITAASNFYLAVLDADGSTIHYVDVTAGMQANVFTPPSAAPGTFSTAFATVANSASTSSISAVPEPTSGLLLLLGMAGLALRRKQK